MKSKEAQTYTDLMADPIVDALGAFNGSLTAGGAPIEGMAECQTRIMAALRALDWKSFGLPDYDFGTKDNEIGEKPLTPSGYAERLMALAFEDFYDLVILTEACIRDHPEEDVEIGELLKNSRQNLLGISRLYDRLKSSFISSAQDPELAESLIGIKFEGSPLQLEIDADGRRRVTWRPALQKFIDYESEPESGCPARHKVITTPDGKKRTLIDFFWDKLVESMYD